MTCISGSPPCCDINPKEVRAMLIYLQVIDAPEDRDQFITLYETYRGLMFYVANQILQNAQDAEDAVHDAFLSVAEHIKKFSRLERHKTKAFLVTIVENKAIDLYRKKTHRKEEILWEETTGLAPAYEPEDGLTRCILKLPARYREFLRLKHELGYSTKEVAELMGISWPAARAGAAGQGPPGRTVPRGGNFMISEDRLRQAVRDAGALLDQSLPDPDQCHHTFSPAFLNRMEALLRRRKRAPVYRVLKGVACFFLLGGTIFLSTNAQAREAFFGWLSEQIGGTVDYRFHNDVSEATHRYRLSEIPSGYWETDRYEAETTGDELYENEAGEYLSFSYQYVTEDTESMLSLFFVDEMEQKTVSINGTPADYYFDNTGTHSNTLVWTDPETKALLTLSAYLEEDTLIYMAENVIREEK